MHEKRIQQTCAQQARHPGPASEGAPAQRHLWSCEMTRSCYPGGVKIASAILTLVGVIAAVGCMSARGGEVAPPMVTVAPDQFVIRDVRKDAAKYLQCQVPMVDVEMGPWAGSEGNLIAYGCGYQVTYYVRCATNHHCSLTLSE